MDWASQQTMKKILKILTNQYFWLLLIILGGFFVRLYKIDAPIADWHSWRQADTAAVTRNFIKDGLNPLVPHYDDMSGVSEKPISNPNTFRFVEFPLYNLAVYPFYAIFGINPMWHRLVSVLFSLGSCVFLFLILGRYLPTLTKILAVAVFTFLPFNVFFSRTTLPEPALVFFSLGMVYFVDKWIWEEKFKVGIWAALFTMAAFLVKPYAAFFLLPLIYSVILKGKLNRFTIVKYFTFLIISLLPFILWRLWILQQSEGIPASNWLFNGDGIRFRPAFWWWIISERLGREILGATGFILFAIGLIVRPKSENYFLYFWLLSMFLYVVTIATGNVRHNYYQVMIVPILAVFLAKGFVDLIKGNNFFIPRIFTMFLALLFLPLVFYFSWTQVKEFYKINNPPIIMAGQAADRILPKDAVVLAPYNGDTAFLYQTNRTGWAFIPSSIKDVIADFGVTSYVSVARDSKTTWIMRHFRVLKDSPQFVVADLTKPTKNLNDPKDPEP